MKILSKFPQSWPHLGFSLVAGDNDIEENKIPLAAHGKLAFYQESGAISGYTPSAALVSAAESHARKLRVKPPVATLETVTAPAAAASAHSSDNKTDEHNKRK